MNEVLALLLAAVSGGLLGLLFFGGLWWTLQRALVSSNPALWFGTSAVLRIGLTVAGFVVISAGQWLRMLACLFGFWLARWLMRRLTAARMGLNTSPLVTDQAETLSSTSPVPSKRTPL